ncbi:MAG: glycosyltransferase family 4 protein, partial [Terracidiphilus sp.]
MNSVGHKPHIAVVSPFLDMGHGTERIVIEWISRLCSDFDFHVYSQDVHHLDLSKITWHRIPKLRGPHLFNYLWWFAANHLWRAWHHRVRGLAYDVVFTPGVNCFDADVISVHIVFGEFARRVRSQLEFSRNPVWFWPRLLHRRLYYRLIGFLERRAYTSPDTTLVVIAKKTLADLDRHYHRRDSCVLVYLGLDHATYNPSRRASLRAVSRATLNLPEARLQLLMIGNDWHKKGIRVLLETLSLLADLPIDLMIVGRDKVAPFRAMVAEKNLSERVRFLPPRTDVEFYYAAADVYVGPSLEDTFALPPVEAMACGIPAIVSRENGAYEIIADGVDGLVLQDPTDAASLASMVRTLYNDRVLRDRIGAKGFE